MQSGMFVVVCMVSTFSCISCISASLFSLWFCLERKVHYQQIWSRFVFDSDSVLVYSERICCILYDIVAASLLKITASDLVSVIILTSLTKAVGLSMLLSGTLSLE